MNRFQCFKLGNKVTELGLKVLEDQIDDYTFPNDVKNNTDVFIKFKGEIEYTHVNFKRRGVWGSKMLSDQCCVCETHDEFMDGTFRNLGWMPLYSDETLILFVHEFADAVYYIVGVYNKYLRSWYDKIKYDVDKEKIIKTYNKRSSFEYNTCVLMVPYADITHTVYFNRYK